MIGLCVLLFAGLALAATDAQPGYYPYYRHPFPQIPTSVVRGVAPHQLPHFPAPSSENYYEKGHEYVLAYNLEDQANTGTVDPENIEEPSNKDIDDLDADDRMYQFGRSGLVLEDEQATVAPNVQQTVSKSEMPIFESSVYETPDFYKRPVIESTVYQGSVVGRPVYERPAVERAFYERPVYERTAVDTPVYEGAVVESAVYERPVVETPIVQENYQVMPPPIVHQHYQVMPPPVMPPPVVNKYYNVLPAPVVQKRYNVLPPPVIRKSINVLPAPIIKKFYQVLPPPVIKNVITPPPVVQRIVMTPPPVIQRYVVQPPPVVMRQPEVVRPVLYTPPPNIKNVYNLIKHEAVAAPAPTPAPIVVEKIVEKVVTVPAPEPTTTPAPAPVTTPAPVIVQEEAMSNLKSEAVEELVEDITEKQPVVKEVEIEVPTVKSVGKVVLVETVRRVVDVDKFENSDGYSSSPTRSEQTFVDPDGTQRKFERFIEYENIPTTKKVQVPVTVQDSSLSVLPTAKSAALRKLSSISSTSSSSKISRLSALDSLSSLRASSLSASQREATQAFSLRSLPSSYSPSSSSSSLVSDSAFLNLQQQQQVQDTGDFSIGGYKVRVGKYPTIPNREDVLTAAQQAALFASPSAASSSEEDAAQPAQPTQPVQPVQPDQPPHPIEDIFVTKTSPPAVEEVRPEVSAVKPTTISPLEQPTESNTLAPTTDASV